MSCWLPVVDQRFKAAVAVSPVTDYFSQHWNSNIGAWDSWFLGGQPEDGAAHYRDRSPVFFADRVTTPTLLTAGTEDRCTPPGQAMEFYRALHARDVPVEVAIYPGEGHGVRKFPASLDLVARTTAWFERFMPARPVDGPHGLARRVPRPRTKAYLISASLGPVSRRSRAFLDGYMDAWEAKGAPDHVWFEDIFPRMAALKRSFSSLAGCDPDEVALTTNIIDRAVDDRLVPRSLWREATVILSELDFPTDGHVWFAWARKTGAEIGWLRSPDGLTIPLEEYDRAIDERTALVMINRVLYRSSAIVDAKAVCAIARERGALSFVDDYHGLGIVPLDLHDLGCDLYTAGVLKWMLGGPGLVFLYARRELLPDPRARPHRLVRTAGAVRVRHRAPRLPPHGETTRARHAAGSGLLHRAGRDRHHLGGRTRGHPCPTGRAHRSSDRARGRGGARRPHTSGPGPPGGRRQRQGGARGGEDLPRAARSRRVHGLPRRRTSHQPPLLQHGSRHRSLLRGAPADPVDGVSERGRDPMRRVVHEAAVVPRQDRRAERCPHRRWLGRGARPRPAGHPSRRSTNATTRANRASDPAPRRPRSRRRRRSPRPGRCVPSRTRRGPSAHTGPPRRTAVALGSR